MTDDGPNYSRNIVRRRQVVTVAVAVAFFSTGLGSAWVGVRVLTATQGPTFPEWQFRLLLLAAFVAGVIAAVLIGFLASRIHRSFWPEHPDEG